MYAWVGGINHKTGESDRAQGEVSWFLNSTLLEKTCIPGMNLNCIQINYDFQTNQLQAYYKYVMFIMQFLFLVINII